MRNGILEAFRVEMPPACGDSTATEVWLRAREFERRIAPHRNTFATGFGRLIAMAFRRRRKSKGWRKHVRQMKSKQR